MAYFPFMIQLDDKQCLIVGGGAVAARKAAQMCEFGACVTVVAPEICAELLAIADTERIDETAGIVENIDGNCQKKPERIRVWKREVTEADISGMDVVIMATDDAELNSQYAELCRSKHILVNVVDVKKDCDFYFPAIIKQGEVVVSVSTGGNSPMLASKIKKDIRQTLRTDYGQIADELGAIREKILAEEPDERARKRRFAAIVEAKMQEQRIRIGTRGSRLAPPLLYDLTTLQQECNKMFGYSANKTLEIAQELYEKKLTTYPRTDAKYITEDMMDTFLDVLDLAQDHADYADTRCIDRKLVKRVIDNSKVTDHHAIIITKDQTNLKDLSQDSRMVYDLIVLRMLSAVSMPYEYYSISADGICNRHEFSMNGVTVIDYGFKANEMKFRNRSKADKEENAEKIMPDISEGDVLQVTPELSEQWTKPPAHYTEASLLGAMDKAGNKEMSDEVERKGLGTSATRAAIIEKLITNGYVERVKKKIVATEAGKYLISVVPDRVKSVSMTCDWENELVEVAAGTKDYAAFMNETEDYIKSLVDEYSKVEPKPWQSQREEICKCPVCGNSVQEGKFGIFCAGKCGLIFSFYKEKLSAKQIKTLLVDNKEVLMKDQTSSKGTKYDIYIKYHGYEPFTYTDKDGHERNAYTMKFDTRFPKNNKKKG